MTRLPDILTPRELADHLRVSEAKIRRLAADGDIPGAFRIGKQWRFHHAAVDMLTGSWQGSHPASPSANDPQTVGDTASDGANKASNAKNASDRVTMPKNAPRKSVDAFARDFPEFVKPSRYAS